MTHVDLEYAAISILISPTVSIIANLREILFKVFGIGFVESFIEGLSRKVIFLLGTLEAYCCRLILESQDAREHHQGLAQFDVSLLVFFNFR